MLSGHSRATVQRILHYWLEHPPRPKVCFSQTQYVVFDGTFLHRRSGMYAALDGKTHHLIYGAYGVNEGPRDLLLFCQGLKQQGLNPKSATIDGNPHIFRTLLLLWPTIVVQRCLVHVQRQGLSWCRQHPKRADARQLRNIFLMVLQIRSQLQRRQFERAVHRWNDRYGSQLARFKERAWVSNDLQRARNMMMNALPFMFGFLDDSNIPRSTNALEGYFSRLKLRYRQHRGLSRRHRLNYFRWYFYLCPR